MTIAALFREWTVAPLARLVSFLMFRQVEVVGLANIPQGASLLVIANHENNLADPMLLLGFTGLRPRFLAKHTLFTHPLVRHLIWYVNALPIYRREDGGDPQRNQRMIELCARAMESGDAIGIFPEGGCHNEPRRRAFKLGAARIAMEAACMDPARPVYALPVGLNYSAKSRFRSSVAVVVGSPIPVGVGQTAKSLNEAMAEGLGRVTLNAPSWEISRQALRDAEKRAGPREVAPGPLERFERHGERLAAVRGETAQEIDREINSPIRWDDLPESPQSLARALLLTPPALVGVALAGLPLALMLLMSREKGRTPDVPATRRLIGTFVFFPPLIAAQSVMIGFAMGPLFAVAAVLATPIGLYAVLRCADAWSDLGRMFRRALR